MNNKLPNILIVSNDQKYRNEIANLCMHISNVQLTLIAIDEIKESCFSYDALAVIIFDLKNITILQQESLKQFYKNVDLNQIALIMLDQNRKSFNLLREEYSDHNFLFLEKPIEKNTLLRQIIPIVHNRHEGLENKIVKEEEFDLSRQGIIKLNPNGIITFCNKPICMLFRSDTYNIVGTHINEWLHKKNEPKPFEAFSFLIKKTELLEEADIENIEIISLSGTVIPVEISAIVNRVKNDLFLTLLLKEEQSRGLNQETLPKYDRLTGLMNNITFDNVVSEVLKRKTRKKEPLIVLIIDVEFLTGKAKTFEYKLSNKILKVIANKLKASLRETDDIAIIDDHKFAALLHEIPNPIDATYIVERIIQTLSHNIIVNEHAAFCSTSVGISLIGNKTQTAQNLLQAAEKAMSEAKKEGQNKYKFYIDPTLESSQEKQNIKIMLHKAIVNKELTLAFQPKVSLSKKRIVGVEALLRWKPTGYINAISPAIFIPIAEESGQIIEIGKWVLISTFEQINKWMKAAEFKDILVSINVSMNQLLKGGFSELVLQQMKIWNIPPDVIEFEITETGLVVDLEKITKEIKLLSKLNIKISLDDFGTGNSTLEYLRNIPIDILKIDRSFVKDITKNKQDEEIVEIVMHIGDTMHLSVIAEGAETESQIIYLEKLRCDLIQGYYFSKPITADEIISLIKNKEILKEKFKQLELKKNVMTGCLEYDPIIT